jgi:glucokinase
VDLGGTKMETSLVDADGGILATHRLPTNPERGVSGVIAGIIECVSGCLGAARSAAEGLGIGIAGQIERDTGVVHFAPNLGWHDVPLGARLEEALHLPVVVTNDVRAATFGEWHYGAGKGVADLICLFVGTGVGGGVVSGGRLLEGCGNAAGELGHVTIVTNGRQCHCRNQGCLEAYVGGWAIAERAREAARADLQAGHGLEALAGSGEQITAATVTQGCADGDALARQLLEETAGYLAAGMVGMVNAFDPCLLVLGGGVVQGLPQLIPMAERIVRDRALEAALEGLRITAAALGNKAGVVGAAAMARRRIGNAPENLS